MYIDPEKRDPKWGTFLEDDPSTHTFIPNVFIVRAKNVVNIVDGNKTTSHSSSEPFNHTPVLDTTIVPVPTVRNIAAGDIWVFPCTTPTINNIAIGAVSPTRIFYYDKNIIWPLVNRTMFAMDAPKAEKRPWPLPGYDVSKHSTGFENKIIPLSLRRRRPQTCPPISHHLPW